MLSLVFLLFSIELDVFLEKYGLHQKSNEGNTVDGCSGVFADQTWADPDAIDKIRPSWLLRFERIVSKFCFSQKILSGMRIQQTVLFLIGGNGNRFIWKEIRKTCQIVTVIWDGIYRLCQGQPMSVADAMQNKVSSRRCLSLLID